ncbi:hypothetical protein [Spiroplasma sp. AdecLV25b]|uniref:hypothetical protein n=1 Tax=Spiroplasma sp. AdecLV25b TaxID=3027162 RepID=UPI0027DF24F2|nr:hypothetical protein [Spiroplasma sp. AdecLV25b]
MEKDIEKEIQELHNKIEELEKSKQDNGKFLSDKAVETITKSAGKGYKWNLIITGIFFVIFLIIVIIVAVTIATHLPSSHLPDIKQ